ncbi:TetR/AcrR family transcriptional regulator [Nonomuraea sp. CA-218870]|uniref:TetR/AcrR family transcriptional regulator n=1 Tax=Nonomuraea sp. CA-218870 TaxID=3239998 RepID=UPI003D8EBF7E
MTTEHQSRAGRPRSERAEKAIITATLDLIADGMGVAELSMEAIAARAGVGKTTIYRRWANKEDLVVDALATIRHPLPALAGESVRDDLVALLDLARREAGHRRARCVMNVALSETDRSKRVSERFYKLALEPRRVAMREVLSRGVANGELRPDLDIELGMALLTGAMIFFSKWGPEGDLPEDLAERVVDHALAGFTPRA